MSKASMDQLASDLTAFLGRIPIAANERKKDAVLSFVNGLTQLTPIDTGAAISNWQTSTGAPATDVIEPYAPSALGMHSHSEHGDVAGAAYNAQGAMDQARAVTSSVQPGETVYIANNDPAVFATDTGLTPLRPENASVTSPGYVDRAITAGVDTMSRAKLDP